MKVYSVIQKSRGSYVRIWLISIFGSLLALSPFLYMMQITERVYASRSWETLGFITLLIVLLMVFWAVLDHFRASALFAVGHKIDHELREGVFDAVHRGNKPEAFRAYGDIATVRQGLTGQLIEAAMDASLSPIFIAVLFLLHPVFGLVAIGYILLLAGLSSGSKTIWKKVRAESQEYEDKAFSFGIATAMRRETIRAMNILPGVRREWSALENQAAGVLLRGQTAASSIEAIISVLQQGQMVIMLAVGAVLYLMDAASLNAGTAAFLVMMRGVNPVVSVARNWSLINDVRSAMQRLDTVLADVPSDATTRLPDMQGHVSCDNLSVVGSDGKPVLSGIRFDVAAGSVVGIIGPSGAGKSTLLRMLSGAGRPSSGSVKVDGFPMAQWPEAQRGPAVGYLPQTVDLLPGTIMQNITRFGPATEGQATATTEALRLAGALDIVQARGRGLDFRLQEDGAPLSGGQRQRIGLARAFYGQPKLLVLDEPNSALDAAGEKTLLDSIVVARQRGATVFFSTHKLNLLEVCDYILVIMDGYMHSFSTREDMLRRLTSAGNAILPNDTVDHEPGGEHR
jgi:PrtD family type I secretion system ABC transporter